MSPSAAVADRYLDRLAGLDPAAEDALGRTPEDLIGPLGPDAFAGRAVLAAATRAELATPDPEDHLGLALAERLDADVALHDSGFTTSLLAPLATPVHHLRQVFDDLPRRTVDDWERVAAHLERVPAGFREYAATLAASAARGHRVAARQVRGVADAVRSWLDPDGTDFYRNLPGTFSGPSTLGHRLAGAATAATAAGERFTDFLTGELLASATEQDAVGPELYRITSGAFLGATVDLDELYAYGWDELRRLTAEAKRVALRATGTADLRAARDTLDAAPSGRVAVGDELVGWLQQRLDETADALRDEHFTIPAATAPVQARMVTAGSGVMYYAPADRGLTRPGRVWWTVPPGVESVPTWREVSTVHHEGLPGHHLQFAITAGLADLHPWQRHLCHVHGYAEGWAHYAEQLAVELGLVRDDAEQLGVLGAQLWRAARIVIDLGLHTSRPIPAGNGLTEQPTWTPEFAVDFLAQVAGTDPATAFFEVQRYLGWPGQALAFKVGARLIEQIRADRERAPGFDRTQFHAALLGAGPMGLGPLRTALSCPPH